MVIPKDEGTENLRDITILDCTLRDGSYAIDFQFTTEDTAIIATGLEKAGFEFIEIGHGVGLNASNSGHGVAAATDEEYLTVAQSVLKKAQFGMFFIPGIGHEEHLQLAASYGMGFVRIGSNVDDVDKSAKYVELAKNLGMTVSANLMKSYALPPVEFLKQAKKSERFGSDILVVVDSAGGMLPQDVFEYVSILKDNTELPIGFHGHNNLGLAVSNTLEAIKAGATVVDTTLRGMGRSAGNAQTEIIVLLLEKLGYSTNIDVYKAMDVAEKILRPLMRKEQGGIDSIGVVSGYAQFHSSFLTTIYNVAQQHNIDPHELIIKVSEIDRVNVSEELAEGIAKELEKERRETLTTKQFWPVSLDVNKVTILNDASVSDIAQKLAKELLSLSKKSGKYSVFTISGSRNPKKRQASFPFIRQNSLCVIGNAEIVHSEEALEIAKAIDGLIDVILIDIDQNSVQLSVLLDNFRKVVRKSRILTYKDSDSLVSAADVLLSLLAPDLVGKKVTILGDTTPGCKLALQLAERGASITIWGEDSQRLKKIAVGLNLLFPDESKDRIYVNADATKALKGADILIGILPYSTSITTQTIEDMQEGGIILDAGIGTISPDIIDCSITHGIKLYRLDMRAGLSGEITTVLESLSLVSEVIGTEVYDGVRIVAGGVLGAKGDIVVDSISQPTRIIGIANGYGGLLEETEEEKYQQNVQIVKIKLIEQRGKT
ncbi:4-hydroxy-2-oxovalerate aldolase [Chloroflexota bacterium]